MTVHESNAVVKFTTWPSSGTTIANEGTGGATYNGTEHTNHYTTTPSYATAQRFLLAADYVSYPHGAAVNNLSAFTLELLWLASSGTGDVNFFTKYLSGGVNVTYIAASSRLYIKRGTTTGSGYETWYCAFTPVNGSWYDIQVSWGTIGSTPIIKINNSSQSLTHDSTGTGAWNNDSVYNGVFIYNGTANAGTLAIVRVHNTNLPTNDLSDNYTEDWKRTLPPPPPPPPGIHEDNCVVKFTTWPVAGTMVQNEGNGGASYAGTLMVNRYTTTPSGASANTLNTSGDMLIVPTGASINNLTGFTLEIMLKYATSTDNPENVFDKSGYQELFAFYTTSTGTTKTMTLTRRTNNNTQDTWTFSWTPTNGSWYVIQISWGAFGSTPIIKINDSSMSLTHANTGIGSGWFDDSSYDIRVGRSGQSNLLKGDYTIFRFHNTNLSSNFLSDIYTEDWKRTSNSVLILGADISAEAGVVGGAVNKTIPGADISSITYVAGGTLKKGILLAGATISAEAAVEGGNLESGNIVIQGAKIGAEASVLNAEITKTVIGPKISAEAAIKAGDINNIITGADISAEALVDAGVLITNVTIGGTVDAEAEVVGGAFVSAAYSTSALYVNPFIDEFVNPYEENAISGEYQYEAAVEDDCVVKYALWPPTGTTVENEMGDSDYDGTAADNDYTILYSDATCFNFDTVSDYVIIPHGAAINNINQFTEEYLFYTNSDPLPAYTDLFMKGWAYSLGFLSDGTIELYRENADGSKWIKWETVVGVITPSRSFYVQFMWDATDYTNEPILKVNGTEVLWNTVENSMTGEDWYNDSGNNLYIFGDSDGAYGNIGPAVLYRRHNAILTDGELLTNYLADGWRVAQNPRAACTQYEEEKPFIICPVDESTNLLESELVADEVNDLTSDEYTNVEAVSLEDVTLVVDEIDEVPGAWEPYVLRPLFIVETVELAPVEEYALD